MAMCTGENSVHLLMVRLKVKREKKKSAWIWTESHATTYYW
jgi:hypothetical protein